MAKKSSKKKTTTPVTTPAAPQLTEEQMKDRAIADLLGENALGASGLANKLYAPESLGRVSTGFNADGGRITENQDILDRLKEISNRYYKSSEGYTPEEMQAFRESAQREGDIALKTATNSLNKISPNLRGGAGARIVANMGRQYGENIIKNEQDINIRNADEKQKRLGEYQGSVNNYGNALTSMRNDELERQKFNLNQVAAEKAGQYGTLFGGSQLGMANKSAQETIDYNKQMLDIAKKRYGGGKKSSKKGASTTEAKTTPSDAYYEAVKNAINNRYS